MHIMHKPATILGKSFLGVHYVVEIGKVLMFVAEVKKKIMAQMPLSLCMWYKFTSVMVGALSDTFSNLNAIYRLRTASQGYDYSTFKLHACIAGPVRDKVNVHS